jgi:hypothetical protein
MSLTPAQMQAKIESDNTFRGLVETYGHPAATGGDCSTKHAGDICMESDCVNGKKIVMKCNSSGGCTEYAVVPC